MNLDLLGQIIAILAFAYLGFGAIYRIKEQDKKYGTFGSPKK